MTTSCRRVVLSLFAFASLFVWLPAPALAQQFDVPRPSPNAKVTQTVGFTDITVDYSSPSVHGRKIWGGLLPYGDLWRAGANAATKLTVSRDVSIGGTTVPAGSYSLFVIPGKANWTVVINKDAQATVAAYKKDLDVVRVDVKPQVAPHRERLAYLFSDFSDNAGTLALEWEKVRVALPFKVGTEEQMATNIKNLVDNAWGPYNNAARYLLGAKKYDQGLDLVERSIAIKENWQNLWVKASLLAGKGKYRDARSLAEKVKELGDQQGANFFAADDVKKAIADWKGK